VSLGPLQLSNILLGILKKIYVSLSQHSHLPLSELTCSLSKKLKECHDREWTEEALSNKIKLVAERRPFLDNAAIICKDVIVKYEDNSLDRLWRWEVGILDILPSAIIPMVRKARMACRKLLNHYMANQKLLRSIQDAEAVVRDMESTKLEATLEKIAKDEEKVLKFEREAEKQRLVQLALKKKEQEVEDRKMEKERKKEEAEKKKFEKEREKQEATEAREAEKRKKQDEKEREKLERLQKEEKKKASVNKQQAFLMSFLAKPKESKLASPRKAGQTAKSADLSTYFDSKRFRSLMDSQDLAVSGPLFPNLSDSATRSRKRKTRTCPLSVHVTVMPDANGFDEQPFAEQQTIHVPNKYRFLSFHEDYRPAYRGTWSKRSNIVTGRTPFGKDLTYLDYDYDSEVEWEEGDDEIGEDVDDNSMNQEDEEEDHAAKMYDYDDGFCVADDQYLDIDEEVDEETKALYRKKLQRSDAGVVANRICIVGPAMGGLPPSYDATPAMIEGFETGEVLELLQLHTGKKMSQDLLWLDAYAPDNIDEIDPSSDPDRPAVTASAASDEYTIEEARTLARFIHHNSLNSKEKLIEELRNANPNVFDSRAKATRKLDSIAEKKKHPSGTGVYWEVNEKVLADLQLHEELVRLSMVVGLCFYHSLFLTITIPTGKEASGYNRLTTTT
jgi:Chromatin assembly factor 1 subunit A